MNHFVVHPVVGSVRARWGVLVAAVVLVVVVVGVAIVVMSRGDDPPRLDFGVGLAVALDGTIYVADRADNTVMTVEGEDLREVLEDSSAGPLRLIDIDGDGHIVFAGSDERVIRVAEDGTRETIIDDVFEIRDVDVGPDGGIYVVGGIPSRLIRIAPDGTRSQVAGPIDPDAESPPPEYVPNLPDGVSEAAFDIDGALLVLSGERLWRIPAGAPPVLVAGSVDPLSEVGGGDGGPAEHALLASPYALTVTADGYLFCDEGGRHVRRVDRQGIINRVVSLPSANGCVDLAAVPGTSDVVVMDESGGVQRLSSTGELHPVLAA